MANYSLQLVRKQFKADDGKVFDYYVAIFKAGSTELVFRPDESSKKALKLLVEMGIVKFD